MTGTRDANNVVVVIPTLNELPRIALVLDQLRQDLPQDRAIRFLVLDGGSVDGTQQRVEELAKADPRISLIPNPRRLQSAAVNLAAGLALPEDGYLLRSDAHTAYPPGFVASIIAVLKRDDVDSVVVPMDSTGTTSFGRATAWASDTMIGSGGSAHRGGRVSRFVDHGHHAGWKLDCFRAAGGYDQSYSHNEDAELDCRINRLGMRVWLAADIRLTYYVRPNPQSLFRQYRNYGRGRSRTIRRHPGSMRLRQFAVPSAISVLALATVMGAVATPAALALPGTYLAALTMTSLHVAMKKRSMAGLLAGLSALTMHVAWTIGFLGGLIAIREARWRVLSD